VQYYFMIIHEIINAGKPVQPVAIRHPFIHFDPVNTT
jgi:hypothetical protein